MPGPTGCKLSPDKQRLTNLEIVVARLMARIEVLERPKLVVLETENTRNVGGRVFGYVQNQGIGVFEAQDDGGGAH